MAKTNKGLVAYAKAQLGLPYWYGCFGQTATEALYNSKKKQYPSYYKASDFPKQYGKRVHDCVGLIKGYIWSDSTTATPKYNAAQDKSAAGMYAASSSKGGISSFPKHTGMLLYKGSTAEKITHVGVYGGDGYVYEAKGHAYGVVKTKFKESEWQYWSQCPYIEDDTVTTTTVSVKPEAEVKAAINTLVSAGVINTREYWEQHCKDITYLDELICNMAANVGKRGNVEYEFESLSAALDKMVSVGVINTKLYWTANYNKVKYLDLLICRFAARL